MTFDWLKRSMPRGIYGRTALILLVPLIALQVVVSVVFIQRHFEDVTRQMTRGIVKDLDLLMSEVDETRSRAGAIANTVDLRRDLDLDVTLPLAMPAAPGTTRRLFYDLSGVTVVATLREEVPELRAVDLARDTGSVFVELETRFGVMGVEFSRRLVAASNPHQFLVIMLVFGVLVTVVAFVYLRNQLRPVSDLANAAEAFGKGRVVSYRPRGALEVRQAGTAFLDMRGRIERQIEQRTLMLSGISHDLRTPLTRLRLGLSMLPEGEDVAAMERDVEEMEALIDAFLDFARADAEAEPELSDPVEIVSRAVEKAQRAGGAVTLLPAELDEGDPVPLRGRAIERALGNLIGNAMRYGKRAEVSLQRRSRTLHFVVEDDGPGIEPDWREQARKPFARLDAARNQDMGSSVGLGLSIAHDIARSHGGRLELGESVGMGGLRAEIVVAV
ncbi:MAG: ATP-binding protein [Pseudomonadota bacterium]